jgi:predicted dienelactone hydrolase
VDAGRDASRPDAPRPDVPILPIDADVTVGEWRDWDPAAPGAFHVGYRAIPITYDAPTLPGRTTTIHVWYPTLVPDGEHPRYLRVFDDDVSVLDAPLAPSAYEDGHYPVHLYSHGDRGFGATSAFLMRRFASHGWVAIAPDHTGNTLDNNIEPRQINLYFLRGTDLTAALDAMGALPASDPLSGLLNLDRVIASGHSFGSHSMWAIAGATFDVDGFGPACTTDGTCTTAELDVFRAGVGDPRVVGAIPMAGSINRTYFGATGHTSVTIPFLSISGGADPVGADTQFASTPEVAMTWVEVADACHQFFALGCDGDAPFDEDLIVGGFALAFARAQVLADASTTVSAILDGSRVLSPRATLMTH